MKDKISKEIFQKYPNYIRGVVIASNVSNYGEHDELLFLLRKAEASIKKDLSLENLIEHPRIVNWRKAYKEFGVNPNNFPPSVESLVRQVLKGREIRYINSLVAIFNYLSLKYLVPSGGDDLDKVKGDLCLRFANGDEAFTPFNTNKVEHPVKGEIIYADDEKILCRCWNWRQGDQTKLTSGTKNVAINVDCLPPVGYKEAERITKELSDLVKKFCGGQVNYYLLHRNQPEIEIKIKD